MRSLVFDIAASNFARYVFLYGFSTVRGPRKIIILAFRYVLVCGPRPGIMF
jgi:hypothetical protein